jgi:DNA excision repair protein ERCC-3
MTVIDLYNGYIKISSPSDELREYLSGLLYYQDKSKRYQLKKMSKNPFLRASKAYEKLQQESEGNLLEVDGQDVIVPPGMSDVFDGYQVNDFRTETGIEISLPWRDTQATIKLRDFQQEAVDIAKNNWRGIINFATGLGKTKTAICLIREIKRKTLVVCPSKSIAKQFKEELEERFGTNRVGFIGDGIFKPSDITVGIAATVNNNIEKIKKWGLGLIIFDEAHHTPATTFYSIAKDLGDTGRIYGLTATSYRSDGKDIFIQAGCGSILIERDIKWGVDNGWLAKPYFLVRKVETGDKDPFPDDKLKSYKMHVLNNKEMTIRIEKDAIAMINAGKSTLILVDQVEHGETLAKVLKIPFAQGEDKQSEEYIDQLNKGKIKGLIATEGKAGEGVDTRNVDCLILANFAGSKGMVIQAVGRGLRKQGTKENCIILDYIPNGSSMLKRHAENRIKWYQEITEKIKIIN